MDSSFSLLCASTCALQWFLASCTDAQRSFVMGCLDSPTLSTAPHTMRCEMQDSSWRLTVNPRPTVICQWPRTSSSSCTTFRSSRCEGPAPIGWGKKLTQSAQALPEEPKLMSLLLQQLLVLCQSTASLVVINSARCGEGIHHFPPACKTLIRFAAQAVDPRRTDCGPETA